MYKFSIIIPVYNAEKTIKKCLESIKVSEYEDYEVIIIDDGSIDNSASIISEYTMNDNRFRMISQENSGPSLARNKGLKLSTGEIITFVDSDDYVRNDYLEMLSKAFEENKADVVFFDFHCVRQDGTELSTYHLPDIQENYYENLVSLSKACMFGYTWIKAFRKEIAHGTYFDTDLSLFEDEIFTCKILERPVNIFYLREPIYYYVRMDGTLIQRTHKEYCQLCDRVFSAWKHLLKMDPNRKNNLENRANALTEICKFYGLERKVNPITFYREMSDSEFLRNATLNDLLTIAIKERKWCKILRLYIKYNIKAAMSKIIFRKVNR